MAKDGAEKGTQELESKGPLGYDRTLWVFWEATKATVITYICVCVYFLGYSAANSLTGTKLEAETCYDTVAVYLRTISVKLIF